MRYGLGIVLNFPMIRAAFSSFIQSTKTRPWAWPVGKIAFGAWAAATLALSATPGAIAAQLGYAPGSVSENVIEARTEPGVFPGDTIGLFYRGVDSETLDALRFVGRIPVYRNGSNPSLYSSGATSGVVVDLSSAAVGQWTEVVSMAGPYSRFPGGLHSGLFAIRSSARGAQTRWTLQRVNSVGGVVAEASTLIEPWDATQGVEGFEGFVELLTSWSESDYLRLVGEVRPTGTCTSQCALGFSGLYPIGREEAELFTTGLQYANGA